MKLFYVLFKTGLGDDKRAVVVRTASQSDAEDMIREYFRKANDLQVRQLSSAEGPAGLVDNLPI